MAKKKPKLELTWIGKENRPKLEPRILLEDPEKSHHAEHRVSENDIFNNMIIRGDNLLSLKALEQHYSGSVKCVYIDPPFNTGGAFEHYDDNLEHSIWLDLMQKRLVCIYKLLREDGALLINLDDTEAAYCKVMLDEIFGRKNYITTIIVEAATPSSFKTFNLGPTEVAQQILFYCKDKSKFKYKQQYVPSKEVDLQHFSRFIENFESPANEWKFKSINDHILESIGYAEGTVQARWNQIKRDMGTDEAKEHVKVKATDFALENAYRVFETKTLQKPSEWLRSKLVESRECDWVMHLPREKYEDLYLFKGRQVYFLSKNVREFDGKPAVSQPIKNIWTDIPTNNLQKEGGVDFPSGKKPEMLLNRILEMTTNAGDLVLDSFLGSGTTAAVAHKMRRRWIGIELGDHCETHCLPRLKKIVNGEDSGGITGITNWQGGGGFRYYKLAPTLITTDKWGNEVINPDFNPAMLTEAVCKIEGFKYEPDADLFWKQGYSTELDFIYVTTQHLNRQQLSFLSEEVGDQATLLVCCGSYTRGSDTAFENLTVKKLPKAVLKRCEWGHDDYSLKVENLPKAPEPKGQTEMELD